jgi:hypothetical protein
MDVHAHRESARTTDPAALQAKVDRIDARLRHNPRARLERRTRPLSEAEAFAVTEQQLEKERFNHS